MFLTRIFTLYPDCFPGPLSKGLYGKAMEKKIWNIETVNIRDYATDKHKTVDDTPYGGGFGMLIKPFLLSLCGSNFKIPKSYKGKCNFEMKKKTARMEWLRVKTEKNAGKSHFNI